MTVRKNVRGWRTAAAVGRATAADGLVAVECTARGGVSRLDIDPRAKRLSVHEMSAVILAAIRDADADLQRQLSAITTDAFGGGLDRALGDPSVQRLASILSSHERPWAEPVVVSDPMA
ncbi:YbaB/EbfC family nucleoid-associated protein [Nonomuraea angiospora]|uniref:YbaB/EbfC family nucleoid-associated protein n=1 Tax=Nonomuraea angiospora TaxID=46172 RepID=UPI0029A41A8C|nr:YbaB/EbfC family nucleoid-associated protein [Nonomuraea angiospora]MDX3099517.1 YbaB/EbfC family nucleoid-associated protein [Nonomuraea angiospora]